MTNWYVKVTWTWTDLGLLNSTHTSTVLSLTPYCPTIIHWRRWVGNRYREYEYTSTIVLFSSRFFTIRNFGNTARVRKNYLPYSIQASIWENSSTTGVIGLNYVSPQDSGFKKKPNKQTKIRINKNLVSMGSTFKLLFFHSSFQNNNKNKQKGRNKTAKQKTNKNKTKTY